MDAVTGAVSDMAARRWGDARFRLGRDAMSWAQSTGVPGGAPRSPAAVAESRCCWSWEAGAARGAAAPRRKRPLAPQAAARDDAARRGAKVCDVGDGGDVGDADALRPAADAVGVALRIWRTAPRIMLEAARACVRAMAMQARVVVVMRRRACRLGHVAIRFVPPAPKDERDSAIALSQACRGRAMACCWREREGGREGGGFGGSIDRSRPRGFAGERAEREDRASVKSRLGVRVERGMGGRDGNGEEGRAQLAPSRGARRAGAPFWWMRWKKGWGERRARLIAMHRIGGGEG